MKRLLPLSLFIISGCATTGIALIYESSYAIGYTNKSIQETGVCLQTWDGYKTPAGFKINRPYTILIPRTENNDFTLGDAVSLYVVTKSDNKDYETQIDIKKTDDFIGSAKMLEYQMPMSYLRACSDKVVIL